MDSSGQNKAQFVSLFFLVIVCSMQYWNNNRISKVTSQIDLLSIPISFYGWQGEDDHFNGKNIYDFIGADKTLLRHYRNKDNVTITLYIGYYPETREGKRPHAARGCYAGQGWSILDDEFFHVSSGKYKLPTTRLLIKQGENYERVYYWFQNSTGNIFATEKATNFSLFVKKIKMQQADIAFVRVTANVLFDNLANYDKVMNDFILHLKPYLNKTLSERKFS